MQGRGRRGSFLFRGHGIVNSGGAFRYQLRSNSRATFPLTAAGVTTLYAAGNYDSSLIDPALEYLRSQMNMFNSYFGRTGHYFYYYGHYYAAFCIKTLPKADQALYQNHLAAILLPLQEKDGSWWDYPFYDYHQQYGTAMALMSLRRCLR